MISQSGKIMLKTFLYITIAIIILFLIGTTAFLSFEKLYQDKIFPGIFVGENKELDLRGATKEDAQRILSRKLQKIDQNGIKFIYTNRDNQKEVIITPNVASFEPDLAYQIIVFNTNKTIDEAYNIGRNGNIFKRIKDILEISTKDKTVSLYFEVNEQEINKILKENLSEFENPAQDAKLVAITENDKITFDIQDESLGNEINYREGINKLKDNLQNYDFSNIELTLAPAYPKIYKRDCWDAKNEAVKYLSLAPITLNYNDEKWQIDTKELSQIIGLKWDDETNKVLVDLEQEQLKNYLEEKIAKKLDKEPVDAKFEIKNNRVTRFQISKDGLKVKIEQNIEKIKFEFLEKQNNEIGLEVEETKSQVDTEEVSMGIKEIIGTGHSNFAGSSKNRIHNINTGAQSISGLLIKPGEEFSLIKALGEINEKTGYLPELVIKGNETIPEYGGGLCQVGTTLFRTVIQSGLPVTARRNHSYRVSYYEPAGTDATIYDPWPDFRFKNDMQSPILIQYRIDGNDLYFDFWGKKEGRKINITEPTIYNIVEPGPTKLIETLDLPVGEKKCTERSHNGADAYFDYTVTYPALTATSTDQIVEERFSSHYVPWREVCLIGVEQLSATSTDEILNETPETN